AVRLDRARGRRRKALLVLGKAATDCAIGLSHRLGDGNVVSSLHCMNDTKPRVTWQATSETKILSHARRRGGRVAARGESAAAADAGGWGSPRWLGPPPRLTGRDRVAPRRNPSGPQGNWLCRRAQREDRIPLGGGSL